MPYNLFTKKLKGKEKFCMQSQDTHRTYCSDSAVGRRKLMQQHEMFKSLKKSGKLRKK